MIILCLSVATQAQNAKQAKQTQLNAQLLKVKEAQEAVVSEQFTKAVECYAMLTTGDGICKENGGIIAEYAYALALAHNFDFALAKIDIARQLGTKYADFYTNQILEIMGCHDLSLGFQYKRVPKWLANDYERLLSSHRVTSSVSTNAQRSELGEAYKQLNQKQFIRSLVTLQKLEQTYPDENVVLLVSSSAWEGVGNFKQAAFYLERGIQLTENEKSKEAYNKHLSELNSKMSRLIKKYNPRLMTYAGIYVAPKTFSFNGRVGFYTNDFFSASMNLSLTTASKQFSGNVGISAYKTWRIFVAGLGLNYQFGGKNHSVSLSPSAGLTFLNKKKTSSFDIMFNCYIPFSSKGTFSYGISIGKTFYF